MDSTQIGEIYGALADHALWIIRIATSGFHSIPGSAIIVRYVQSSHQNDPIRSVMELVLVVFAVCYYFMPTYSPKKANNHVSLSETEVDELVNEWTPEPLVSEHNERCALGDERVPVLHRDSPIDPKTKLRDGKDVTNLATYNHYNFSRDPALVEQAVQTTRTYGVGPCSAPGFYGTFDVHQKLEQDIASHFGTESAIIYSQSFSTISSVIPAFCKRGDIIVADEAVNYSIRKGIQASRCLVQWFKHNDMNDLQRILDGFTRSKKPLTRRFIVTEGLSELVGDMADLHSLVQLKTHYKFRILLDETWSYGILGATGRGATELQQVDPNYIDMIVGSLAGGIASGGGFCTGSKEVIEHQRLNAAAFTYSAALPAFLTTTASNVIARLQSPSGSEAIFRLSQNTNALRAQIEKSEWVRCTSAPQNPVLLLVLKDQHVQDRRLSVLEQDMLLQDCVDECLTSYGVVVTRLKAMPVMDGLSNRELAVEWQPQPALRICATIGISKKETERAGTAVRHAISAVTKRPRWQRSRAR